MLSHCSRVGLFENLWTVAHQVLLPMWFSKQEHWSGFPCPPPEDLPDLDIELTYLMSPALAARFFTTRATWEAPQHKDNWMLTDPKRTTKNGSLSQRYTWSSHIVVVQLLSYV